LKNDCDENQANYIKEMAGKFDRVIDIILNKFNTKHHFIQDFVCYIVELNKDIINLHPNYQNYKNDINLRFIITSKNIYYIAIEFYFILHDLYEVNFNIFSKILKKRFIIENNEKYLFSFKKIEFSIS
jgi:hypothetical protein